MKKFPPVLSDPKTVHELKIITEAKCNDCKSGNIAIHSYFDVMYEESKETEVEE